jgi:threonine dehydrogenase-like Zn-dependent dehydrogenase
VRLDKALEIGATDVINAREGALFDQVAAITGGHDGYQGKHADIAVVFDCAGYIEGLNRPVPLQSALDVIVPNTGRIICFGAYEGKVTLDLEYLISKQPTIMGSLGYAAEELVEALDLMASKKVDRLTLLSHRFPLDQIYEAFETQLTPQSIKVMIDVA